MVGTRAVTSVPNGTVNAIVFAPIVPGMPKIVNSVISFAEKSGYGKCPRAGYCFSVCTVTSRALTAALSTNGYIGNGYSCRSYVCAVDGNTGAAERSNGNTVQTKLVSVPVMVTSGLPPDFADSRSNIRRSRGCH